MNPSQARDEVKQFFSRWGGASLKLPNGWFGRPYDSFHELDAVTATDDTLTIVLDETLRLSIRHPGAVTVEDATLVISDFADADWQWSEYGSGVEHRKRFDGGTIEFVGSGVKIGW